MSKMSSLSRVTVAYIVAIAVGAAWLIWGPQTPWFLLDTLIADLLATLVIFGFSRYYGNSSFYDAYWSVIPPLIMFAWWIERDPGADALRFWLAAVVMLVWAVRLTGNWAYAFPGLHHEDWRYPMLRDRAGRWELLVDLFAIHVFPTLQVFAALVPLYVVTRSDRPFGWLDVVALVIGLGAIAIESIADVQMHRFVRDKVPGAVMDRGLWAWSRHPNYLGEFGFWFSLAVFGLAASPAAWWWIFLGAAAMLVMLLAASIPMMEERSLERRPDYQRIIDSVPRLFPRPPRRPSA